MKRRCAAGGGHSAAELATDQRGAASVVCLCLTLERFVDDHFRGRLLLTHLLHICLQSLQAPLDIMRALPDERMILCQRGGRGGAVRLLQLQRRGQNLEAASLPTRATVTEREATRMTEPCR